MEPTPEAGPDRFHAPTDADQPVREDSSPNAGPQHPDDPILDGLVSRTAGLQPWRRVLHATTGLIVAAVLYFGVPPSGVVTVAMGTACLFFRIFLALVSPREAARVASSTWYVLGLFLVLALFPVRTWIPSALVLALADPFASVVGRIWGRRRIGKGTAPGMAAFWGVATACLLPFVGLWQAPAIALAVAIVEVAPLPVDDNVSVPVATAGLVGLLGG